MGYNVFLMYDTGQVIVLSRPIKSILFNGNLNPEVERSLDIQKIDNNSKIYIGPDQPVQADHSRFYFCVSDALTHYNTILHLDAIKII